MPVRIRQADVHTALFSVDADAAQDLIDYSGLQVCRYRPGKAVVNLMLARYLDGDLGPYNEFGTAVMVNPPGSNATGWRALGAAGAFIHHLPVDQAFTLEAGRTIWGFPKIMADFTVRDRRQFGFDVAADGRHIASMEFDPGLGVPSLLTSRPRTLTAFSHLDGVTRQTAWEMRTSGLRIKPSGTTLQLGTHPYARELAALGLPKRPMMSASVARVAMTFGDAETISR